MYKLLKSLTNRCGAGVEIMQNQVWKGVEDQRNGRKTDKATVVCGVICSDLGEKTAEMAENGTSTPVLKKFLRNFTRWCGGGQPVDGHKMSCSAKAAATHSFAVFRSHTTRAALTGLRPRRLDGCGSLHTKINLGGV